MTPESALLGLLADQQSTIVALRQQVRQLNAELQATKKSPGGAPPPEGDEAPKD